jgi:hypothetical protein
MLVNSKELIYMFLAQELLNEKYNGKDWRDQVSRGKAKIAFLDEVSEFARELEPTWKWWSGKAQAKTIDRDKAIFELIDAIHFGLLLILHQYSPEEIIQEINRRIPPEASVKVYQGDPHDNFSDSVANFLKGVNFNCRVAISMLLDVIESGGWLIGGLNSGDLFVAYGMKNKLNAKRVEGGQLQGTYDKSREAELKLLEQLK